MLTCRHPRMLGAAVRLPVPRPTAGLCSPANTRGLDSPCHMGLPIQPLSPAPSSVRSLSPPHWAALPEGCSLLTLPSAAGAYPQLCPGGKATAPSRRLSLSTKLALH